ncbi:hypothetical protein KP806_18785 [Paenibacillus sp. N4]|uniref:hypothetical protein n=1 Tax=Paenibacillus vietnamensis TaxID=2590547 RepID=UPI001CD04DF0|nr:hypothetical protein [Paenibacillus vietnamensis]MCA0757113.1 hypothetical protein [Paenibacillus vietnamensis]
MSRFRQNVNLTFTERNPFETYPQEQIENTKPISPHQGCVLFDMTEQAGELVKE